MSEPPHGYASLVGEWSGSLGGQAVRSVAAVASALQEIEPILASLHRPSGFLMSWSERDERGEEVAYHELEPFEVTTWSDVHAVIERFSRGAIESVFVQLDTEILEGSQKVWRSRSAELQLSVDPADGDAVHSVEVRYATFIDVWLATTYGEAYRPLPNPHAAANLPRLAAVLRELRALLGPSFRVGQSQLYPFAITDTGFSVVNDLPVRRPP